MKKNLVAFAIALIALITVAVITACEDGIPTNPFLKLPTKDEKPAPKVPLISSHPQDAVYTIGAQSVPLTVSASTTDGGTLSYQWHRDETPIDGETQASYTPLIDTLGTVYYYAIVTNTLNKKNAVARSTTARIEVNNKVNATAPLITAHPQDAVYTHGETAEALTVSASADDGGTLAYQWYRNTENSNQGGTLISGATGTNYRPLINTLGTVYYYVEVKNTISDNGDGGNKTAVALSNTAKIEVNEKVNAAALLITVHPQDAVYTIGAQAVPLTVSASAGDGGTLSYQWYRHTENSNLGGALINGAAESRYTPPTTAVGVVYYYVFIVNTIADNGDGGNKTATARSATAKIEINDKVNATAPEITAHPQDAVYTIGAQAVALTVNASADDGGTLAYQWYRNEIASNEGGTAIDGATGEGYTPLTDALGTTYYYAEVTNTISDNGDGGNKSAVARSYTAGIEVNDKVNAAAPEITAHPQDAVYTYGDTAEALTVEAEVSDGGTLAYQWYRNEVNSNEGGTLIDEATEAGYTPQIDTAGTVYYYVQVTNTIEDNGDGGNKTATVRSNTAEVTVARQIVTITGLSAANKTYDRTTTASVTGTAVIVGLIPGDDVAVNRGTATFDNGNAGTRNVTFSGWTLGGSAADNYILSEQPASVTANITHRTVTLRANSKTYDGNTTATIMNYISDNLDGGNLTVSGGTAAFDTKDVGTNKTVTLSGWSLGGSAAGNYTLAASTTASINRKTIYLSINGNVTLSPVDTTANLNVNITGLIGSDAATVSCITALPTGITFTSGTRTFTYDGTTAFANPSVRVEFSAYAGSNYTTQEESAAGMGIMVYDGQADYTGASGTFDRRIPVRSANIAAFNTYARTANGLTRHYKLVGNVTLSGTNNWTPIGDTHFTGSFDGQGNAIGNMTIGSSSTENYKGMFGCIGSGGMVRNLGLVGGSVSASGTQTSPRNVGRVAGRNYGTVQNCYATGSVSISLTISGSGYGSNGGGVVGINYGTVQNCYATGSVSGDSGNNGFIHVGGVVGSNINTGTVRNCYATGSVSGSYGLSGGVVGVNSGMVQNCYATSSVSGGRSGGVVGETYDRATVQNCVALNPRVTAISGFIGRVVGYIIDVGTLYPNFARATGMTLLRFINDSTSTYTPTSNLDGKDGQSTVSYNDPNFWTNPGTWYTNTAWDFTNVWEWNNTTKLPILRNMPAGEQNHTVQGN